MILMNRSPIGKKMLCKNQNALKKRKKETSKERIAFKTQCTIGRFIANSAM